MLLIDFVTIKNVLILHGTVFEFIPGKGLDTLNNMENHSDFIFFYK